MASVGTSILTETSTPTRQSARSNPYTLNYEEPVKFLPNLEVVALEDIGEVSDSFVLDDLVAKGVKVHVVGR